MVSYPEANYTGRISKMFLLEIKLMTELVLVVVGLTSIVMFAIVIFSLNRMHHKRKTHDEAFRN